jgi:hypothetical protein
MIKERQFLSIYKGYLDSGLTVRDYCINQNMKESMFFYWQNKLRGQLPPKRGFIPVVFDTAPKMMSSQVPAPAQNQSKIITGSATDHPISCEINYPNGVCLKLNGLTDPEMLRSLLLITHQ